MKKLLSEEGINYPTKDNEVVIAEYHQNDHKKAVNEALNRAVAYSHWGFRTKKLNNGNFITIAKSRKKQNVSRFPE